MQVTVIATLCKEIITDEATLMQCGGAFAQQAISKWMSEHPLYREGWRLSKWGCAIGGYRKPVHA